ncbi:hypothetical protein [Acetobacter sp. DsW_063]|uniref:hypothetical protein n=1 Tax=Acetobacter sp. DsW_063 TaxID=1514894 RepID=UPI001302C6F1|nr:hypothetical protein [Acetobacter sp. DsW_063]
MRNIALLACVSAASLLVGGRAVAAGLEITAQPAATSLAGTDVVPVVRVVSGTPTLYQAPLSLLWAAYAPLSSPALTGVPTAPTATAGSASTQIATTAYADAAVAALSSALTATITAAQTAATQAQTTANAATTSAVTVSSPGTSYAAVIPAYGSVVYDITPAAAMAVTFSGGTAGVWTRVTLLIRQPSAGGYAVALPAASGTLKYLTSGGAAPTISTTAGSVSVLTCGTDDASATVICGL